MTKFLETFINGSAVGSLYALIALGYTMVYGILKFINFAHSDVFVVGAWMSLSVAVAAGWTTEVPPPSPPGWMWTGMWILLALTAAGAAIRALPARVADRNARLASLRDNGGLLALVGAWAWLTFGLFWAARFCKAHQLGVLSVGTDPVRHFELLSGTLVLITAMSSCGLLGYLIERLAYRPLRSSPRLNVLITAIGVSLLLQNTGQLKWFFGPSPKRMPSLLPDVVLVEVAGVPIHMVDVIGAGTAILLMIVLEWLVFRTKLGRAMRAVSFNPTTAALMGIPVDRVISITFVTGAMLAAAAGFLYALKYPGLNQPAYSTWLLLGLKAFVAAVVGGIGNVRGAMLGGIFIGWIEFFGVAYVGSFFAFIGQMMGASSDTLDYLSALGTSLRDVYVFALLILVLLVRPGGLLGRATVEKV